MESEVEAVAKGRRVLRLGLGILWLVDGLLQAQPGMFTMDMVSTIMQPAATGEPGWLSHLIDWSIRLVTPHLVPFNWSVVALQLALGVLLLLPWRGAQRLGLGLSVAWGLTVWLFGEGLGQLLSGSATFVTGAPGSALVYALAAGALLLPPSTWHAPVLGRHSPATVAALAIFLLGFGLQVNPLFWTSLGAANAFGEAASMGGPAVLRASLSWAATLAGAHPVLTNLAEMGLMAIGALAVAFFVGAPWALWVDVGVLAVLWYFGQAMGMLFTGMATDPNTAPVMALLLVAGHLVAKGHAQDKVPGKR